MNKPAIFVAAAAIAAFVIGRQTAPERVERVEIQTPTNRAAGVDVADLRRVVREELAAIYGRSPSERGVAGTAAGEHAVAGTAAGEHAVAGTAPGEHADASRERAPGEQGVASRERAPGEQGVARREPTPSDQADASRELATAPTERQRAARERVEDVLANAEAAGHWGENHARLWQAEAGALRADDRLELLASFAQAINEQRLDLTGPPPL